MPTVHAGSHGELLVVLEDYEADVLRNLTAEMKSLLESELSEWDPIGKRLFPDAFENKADSIHYRELIGDELRAHKLHNAAMIREKLGSQGEAELELAPEEIERWLALLTDMRLAIGTRLEVTEETMDAEIDPNKPNGAAMSVLHWLGWLQEASLEQLSEEGG